MHLQYKRTLQNLSRCGLNNNFPSYNNDTSEKFMITTRDEHLLSSMHCEETKDTKKRNTFLFFCISVQMLAPNRNLFCNRQRKYIFVTTTTAEITSSNGLINSQRTNRQIYTKMAISTNVVYSAQIHNQIDEQSRV